MNVVAAAQGPSKGRHDGFAIGGSVPCFHPLCEDWRVRAVSVWEQGALWSGDEDRDRAAGRGEGWWRRSDGSVRVVCRRTRDQGEGEGRARSAAKPQTAARSPRVCASLRICSMSSCRVGRRGEEERRGETPCGRARSCCPVSRREGRNTSGADGGTCERSSWPRSQRRCTRPLRWPSRSPRGLSRP